MVLLVSACLLGLRCRYDGQSKRMDGLERLLALPFPSCPSARRSSADCPRRACPRSARASASGRSTAAT